MEQIGRAILFAVIVAIAPRASAKPRVALFSLEIAAKAHCPQDIVVWLNTETGIYHFYGERWYGRTEFGAYVCEKEAGDAGNRASATKDEQ